MDITGLFLTVVTPAPNGCNLKCPFCAISHRHEAEKPYLADEDYLRFMEEAATAVPITRFSFQGYEPLLPECWELTKHLFKLADRFDLETSVVTNGTYLTERAEELSGLADLVVVSIDSADEKTHDRLRGVPGTHRKAFGSLPKAVSYFGDGVAVNSVLFPGREQYLKGMPKLLSESGVRDWSISPLIDFVHGRYYIESGALRNHLLAFTAEARAYGVETHLSDELRRFDVDNLYQTLSVDALEQSEYVVRLSPDGTCSRGREILGPSSLAPQWDKKERADLFLRRILSERGHRIG